MFPCNEVSIVIRMNVWESYTSQVAVGEVHAMEVLKIAPEFFDFDRAQ